MPMDFVPKPVESTVSFVIASPPLTSPADIASVVTTEAPGVIESFGAALTAAGVAFDSIELAAQIGGGVTAYPGASAPAEPPPAP